MQDRRSRPAPGPSEPPPASAAVAWDGEARARAKDAREVALEAADTAREALAGVRELVRRVGEPPGPGVPGTGIVGELMTVGQRLEKLEERLDEVLQELRASAKRDAAGRRRRWAGIASVVAALGGAGAAVASALRGAPQPPAQSTPVVVEAKERRVPVGDVVPASVKTP